MHLDLARYLSTCMWWNGRMVWVNPPTSTVPALVGAIVRVAPARASRRDVELTVLLEQGAVVCLRASEKGKLWDFN